MANGTSLVITLSRRVSIGWRVGVGREGLLWARHERAALSCTRVALDARPLNLIVRPLRNHGVPSGPADSCFTHRS